MYQKNLHENAQKLSAVEEFSSTENAFKLGIHIFLFCAETE